MSMKSERRRLSGANIALVTVCAIGAIASGTSGNAGGAAFLAVLAAGVLVSALWGRRRAAGDLTRVNALEYRDERDLLLARSGFAVTGGAALMLSVIEVVVATYLAGWTSPTIAAVVLTATCAQLLVLSSVWGIANWRAVRGG